MIFIWLSPKISKKITVYGLIQLTLYYSPFFYLSKLTSHTYKYALTILQIEKYEQYKCELFEDSKQIQIAVKKRIRACK